MVSTNHMSRMAQGGTQRWRGALALALGVFLLVGVGIFAPAKVSAIPLLSNDEGLHLVPGDSLFPHYEYEEELTRKEIERELEKETREKKPKIVEELIEQEIPGGSRTSFLSKKSDLVPLLFVGNSFSYYHQVPPAVSPDVSGSPKFDDFDFTHDLIEFELELKGKRGDSSSAFEVRLRQAGVDIASLGAISFDSGNRFEFEFKQMVAFLGGTGMAPQINTAILDGILDVGIVRTAGTGNLYLFKSELEVEIPQAVIPEPGTLLLLGSGLVGLAARGWRRARRGGCRMQWIVWRRQTGGGENQMGGEEQ